MNTMEHASTTMGPTYATVQMVGKGNTAPMVDYSIKRLKDPNNFCHVLSINLQVYFCRC